MTAELSRMVSDAYEDRHVHQVYDQIASHFSSTRYKPWPVVEQFLTDLPDGAIGLDIGCGNGKYLAVNPKIYIVASDRSESLVRFATKHQPHSSLIAENLNLPHPKSFFDFAISIAVIHHLSTAARRIEALSAVLETLRPVSQDKSAIIGNDRQGKALFLVWALEQKCSRRGWDEGDEQDVMVPWVMTQKSTGTNPEESRTFHRYYHLYRHGELEEDIVAAGGVILGSGYEKDNWWAIAGRRSPII